MKTPPNPADLNDAEIERGMRSSRQLEDAPEHVIQRALAAWQPRRQVQTAPGLIERILAVLTFDSAGASPLAYGARSAGATTRQLLFSAQGHDIDLRVSPAAAAQADHWLLSGQVLGPQGDGTVLLSDEQGQSLGEALLNELGEFRLPAVRPGQYTVTVRLGGAEIVLPAVYVPQAI